MDIKDLENRFTYHPPNEEKVKLHESLRKLCLDLAVLFNDRLPEGREKSLVITHLEEVMFWANAAIARSGNNERVQP